jgi:hypothetical protein
MPGKLIGGHTFDCECRDGRAGRCRRQQQHTPAAAVMDANVICFTLPRSTMVIPGFVEHEVIRLWIGRHANDRNSPDCIELLL